MDPFLQDNVLVPDKFLEFIYHVGSYFNMHPIIKSGLLAGVRNFGRDRQTVLFTVADPMSKNWIAQEELGLTQSRHAAYNHKWKVSQDAVYWVDMGRAQRMGLKFFLTRSNAIILHAPQAIQTPNK